MKWRVITLVVIAAILGVGLLITLDRRYETTSSPAAAPPKSTTKPAAGFNKKEQSIDDRASLWLVVNKQRPISPQSYQPLDLVVPDIPLRANITSNEQYVRAGVSNALTKLVTAADAAGLTVNLQSGFRSYNFQTNLYNSYVKQQGQATADAQSARPGFSEHQTGLAADLGGTSKPSCNVEECFGATPEGVWLQANAYKYGFISRYPANKQPITGYQYEPWHFRFVGPELATEMHKQNIATLEEFFDLPAAPDYN